MKSKIELATGERIVFEDKDVNFVVTELLNDEDQEMSTYYVYDSNSGEIVEVFDEERLKEQDFENSKAFDIYMDILDERDSNYNDYSSVLDDFYTRVPIKPKTPEEIEAEKQQEREEVESLCKSDTIVFHLEDSSTVMLNPIYEGKGWDVYKKSSWSWEGLSKESIHELIKRHDKIICLGHGTPNGLIGGNIGKDEVPLLKDKKIFALWCYAATFFKNNGFSGHGILCCDNAPSEKAECAWIGYPNVREDWIFNNMLAWSYAFEHNLELSWTDPKEACMRVQEEYAKTMSTCGTEDERAIVEFNTNTVQVV